MRVRPASDATSLKPGKPSKGACARTATALSNSTQNILDLEASTGERSPLLDRRGGRDIKKNIAKLPLMERTGWWITIDRVFLNLFHHPGCGAKVASRHLLDATATPPVQEG